MATLKQFDDLGRFAAGKVETLGKEILSGNIGIHPYMKGNKKACTYCLFQSICAFDERIDGFSYRRLGDLDAKAAWEEIRRWNEAGADRAGKDSGSRPPAPAGSETASGGSGRPAPVDSEAAAGGSGRPEPADSIKEVKGHGGEVDG